MGGTPTFGSARVVSGGVTTNVFGELQEVITGPFPGTSFITTNLFVTHTLWVNGVRQKLVAAAPALGEYTYSLNVLTTGSTINATDWVFIEGFIVGDISSEEPAGARPGTSFTTGVTYTAQRVLVNGVRQKLVSAGPLIGEYTYVGTTLITGSTINPTDWFILEGFIVNQQHLVGMTRSEEPAGVRPGTSFTITVAFVTQRLFVNGVRQKQVSVAPSIGEYIYAGIFITTGSTIFSTDWFIMEGTA